MVAVFPQKHLTNIAEWHRMGEAGIFPPESRLELIEGEILTMAPIGFNHAGHVNRLNRMFARLWDEGVDVRIQSPLQLGDLSEPEPDLALVKPDADDYTTRHPEAADVLLLVEVSDSTLRFDRAQKLRLYATHGIAEYWIVNLVDNCLEVYRRPQDGDYLDRSVLTTADSIDLVALPALQVSVAAIL
ncbi:Uma2 family endonuclease [Methylomonas sp. Kb3]|uniref:Uma2 family endonuclease n=1 Tax=unclassified Methylomonas TaxID=2608980 RepID=UPI000C34B19D|nr:Uma2 family endonuclease [Methylomonas sp. Kb3]PKD42131.1 Uma2 family endonuclease [Methylomonas sp. Kb3]